jgi:hypothetical protein
MMWFLKGVRVWNTMVRNIRAIPRHSEMAGPSSPPGSACSPRTIIAHSGMNTSAAYMMKLCTNLGTRGGRGVFGFMCTYADLWDSLMHPLPLHTCRMTVVCLLSVIHGTKTQVQEGVGTSRRKSGSPKSWWPQVLKPALKPAPKRGKEPTAKLQPVCPSLSLMGNVFSCSIRCRTTRGSSALSLFRRRGRQKTDEWMQCIEAFAYLHYVHGTISIYACQRESQSLGLPTTSN